MDTDEDIKSSPMAVRSGFRSGLARAIILRNEVAFFGVVVTEAGNMRDNKDDFGGFEGSSVSLVAEGPSEYRLS
jgi:hypothetical protein